MHLTYTSPTKALTQPERHSPTDSPLRRAAVREFVDKGIAGISAARTPGLRVLRAGRFRWNEQAMLLSLSREAIVGEFESWLAVSAGGASLDEILSVSGNRARPNNRPLDWARQFSKAKGNHDERYSSTRF